MLPIEIIEHMALNIKTRRNLRKVCTQLQSVSLPSFYESRQWSGFEKLCRQSRIDVSKLRKEYWRLPQYARITWSVKDILYYRHIDSDHLVPDIFLKNN